MYRPTDEKCPGVDSVATRILFGSVVICNGGNDACDSCRWCRRTFPWRMTEPAALFMVKLWQAGGF